jgi:hypothetical protein
VIFAIAPVERLELAVEGLVTVRSSPKSLRALALLCTLGRWWLHITLHKLAHSLFAHGHTTCTRLNARHRLLLDLDAHRLALLRLGRNLLGRWRGGLVDLELVDDLGVDHLGVVQWRDAERDVQLEHYPRDVSRRGVGFDSDGARDLRLLRSRGRHRWLELVDNGVELLIGGRLVAFFGDGLEVVRR